MENRKDFRERVDGQPQPEHLCMVAEACAQFVQLQMWEPEMAEGALMQGLRMLACTSEKGS
jgi:hypothetical protein